MSLHYNGNASEAPWAVLPADLSDRLRPHLPAVVDEVIATIARDVPSYARPLEGRFGERARQGAEAALGRFLDLAGTAQPALGGADRQMARRLGRGELRHGRSMTVLLAAYRSGARVAFRRFAAHAQDAGVDPGALVPLAEATFAYIDELSSASVEGYAAEQSARTEQRDLLRVELLTLLLSGAADPAAAAEAATAAGWPPPTTVVAIIVASANAEGLGTALGPQALLGPHSNAIVALVPAPSGPAGHANLAGSLRGRAAVLGPARPWTAAASSLRMAMRAARLAHSGVLSGDPLVIDDHLATVILHSDPELIGELAAKTLAPLHSVRAGTAQRLAETLLWWLALRGERRRVAQALHVHPQTVSYRVGRLRELFGTTLDDPDKRFQLEMALRADRDRQWPTALLSRDRKTVTAF